MDSSSSDSGCFIISAKSLQNRGQQKNGTLSDIIESLYFNKLKWDVEIKIKNEKDAKTFFAHKVILSMWSPIFADMFETKDEKQIEIKGCSILGFELLLKFLYGCLSTSDLNENGAIEAYKAADNFQIEQLRAKCKNFISRVRIHKDNVFKFMTLAHLMKSDSVMEKCFGTIEKDTRRIMNSPEFTSAPIEIIMSILQVKNMYLKDEFELIEYVFAWAKSRYIENHAISSLREVMEPLLPFLDFKSLNCKQLAQIIENRKEFFSVNEGFSLFMHIAYPNTFQPMPKWYNPNFQPRIFTDRS